MKLVIHFRKSFFISLLYRSYLVQSKFVLISAAKMENTSRELYYLNVNSAIADGKALPMPRNGIMRLGIMQTSRV